jgi:anti-sigma regulatory factor (Ser/Thr protein kinase)
MLEAADRALRAEQPDRFVTAFVGVIDPIAATITFAGAGHPAPIVRAPDGSVTHLESQGLPLGLRDHGSSDTRVAALEPGMIIALYTDGLVESTHDIVAGDERLCRVFADSAIALAADPAAALLAGVLDQRSRDDVAILTVAIGPPPAAQRWTFDPCDARAGRAMQRDFHDRLRAGGLADHLADGAELVLAELIGNLVRHAPGEAEVVLQWDAGWPPVLHVLDSGPGFTFAAKLPSDVLSESGRGLFLIAALTQDFHVTRRAGTGSHARAVLTT